MTETQTTGAAEDGHRAARWRAGDVLLVQYATSWRHRFQRWTLGTMADHAAFVDDRGHVRALERVHGERRYADPNAYVQSHLTRGHRVWRLRGLRLAPESQTTSWTWTWPDWMQLVARGLQGHASLKDDDDDDDDDFHWRRESDEASLDRKGSCVDYVLAHLDETDRRRMRGSLLPDDLWVDDSDDNEETSVCMVEIVTAV